MTPALVPVSPAAEFRLPALIAGAGHWAALHLPEYSCNGQRLSG
ncbi:MAG TPA: hypothetical protein VHY84_07430 [Bryobacteraceae bacterium]|jgi:hypothetical protein|nr:hypothetical protein [Bryobacteraceae bacterium]